MRTPATAASSEEREAVAIGQGAGGKRKAEAQTPWEESLQTKFQKTLSDSAEELLCPLTQTLPVDPVTADDGRLYERKAIEQWLQNHLTSPVTREPMTARLLPAVQVRSLIERLVQSGALPPDDVANWHQERSVAETDAVVRRRAESGSGEAQALIAQWRIRGTHGESCAVHITSPLERISGTHMFQIPLWLQSAIAAASAKSERVCLDDERYSSPRAGVDLARRLRSGRLEDISATMRRIAVDWLVEVQVMLNPTPTLTLVPPTVPLDLTLG